MFKKIINNIAKEVERNTRDHASHNASHHRGPRDHHRGPVYFCVIKKSSMFWEGIIPNITFCKASLCDSYDDAYYKITEKLTEEIEKCMRFNKPLPEPMNPRELEAKFPLSYIVEVFPKLP